MDFCDARDFVMLTGKHPGRTLDQIATTDVGLLYLDALRRERGRSTEPLDKALAAYLSDPTIAKDLKQAARKDSRRMTPVRGEGMEWKGPSRHDPSAD